MHPNFFKLSSDKNNNDDEKQLNNGLVSIIDNDFFLDFLNNDGNNYPDSFSGTT